MHFLFVSSINAYKCHIINFLLTSLARYVQRNIGPRSFCTNLALRVRSVQKRPRSDISLYRPRVRLIRSYYRLIISPVPSRSAAFTNEKRTDKTGLGMTSVSYPSPTTSTPSYPYEPSIASARERA